MQHLHPVERLQALGDLLDNSAHGFQVRFRIVDHPLGQGLPIDEFRHDVQIISPSRLDAGLQDVGAVDAPGDPFFHHESLQVGRVVAQVDRRNLDGDQRAVRAIDGQVDVASAAAVDFPDDLIPVQHHSRFQQRRARQFRRLPDDFAALAVRQFVDSDDLDGQIVRAALPLRLFDNGSCGAVQIVRAAIDCFGDKAAADMLVDAVGRQQKEIAFFDRDRPVVDLDLRIDAQGAAQIALLRRNDDPVIFGQLFEGVAGDAVDAGVADMKNVRRRRLDDHRAERAHVAPVLVVEDIGFAGFARAARNLSRR